MDGMTAPLWLVCPVHARRPRVAHLWEANPGFWEAGGTLKPWCKNFIWWALPDELVARPDLPHCQRCEKTLRAERKAQE